MNIHTLLHVPFEDPGYILEWIKANGHHQSKTELYKNSNLPDIKEFDLLIIMGGPMNIYEHDKYPWLVEEKKFIKKAISDNKPVLGICLGAQLIADVLGSKIYTGEHKEIGWFQISFSNKFTEMVPVKNQNPYVFHWHSDTFDIPDGAIPVARSEACLNQGFIYQNKVIAFQFHLESTPSGIRHLIENCSDELVDGSYIQNEHEISNNQKYYTETNQIMDQILNQLADNVNRT